MKAFALFAALFLTILAFEAGAQSLTVSSRAGLMATVVPPKLLGRIDSARGEQGAQAQRVITPSARSNGEIIRHLYSEKHEIPFWKR